jgi:hypothetical protein
MKGHQLLFVGTARLLSLGCKALAKVIIYYKSHASNVYVAYRVFT